MYRYCLYLRIVFVVVVIVDVICVFFCLCVF